MIKVKNIVLFLSLFILTGCVSYYDKDSFEKKEKSLVFFDIKQDQDSLDFTLTRYKDKKEFQAFGKGFANVRKPLSLEPGIYYLSYISVVRDGHGAYSLIGPGMRNGGIIQYGAFEIKEGGKVLNFGMLSVDSRGRFKYVDNNLDFIERLSESKNNEFFELENKVEKGEFYDKASRLVLDENGKPKLIHAEKFEKERMAIIDELKSRLQNYSE